jgi:hypothetical protein
MRWAQPLISLAVLGGGLGIAAMSAVTGPTEAAYTRCRAPTTPRRWLKWPLI